jgi:hypothetical protein
MTILAGEKNVRPAQSTDRYDLANLRTLLWPDTKIEEHLIELHEIFLKGTNSTLPMTILVAHDENNALPGFIEVAMRSHADGFARLVTCRFTRAIHRGKGITLVHPVKQSLCKL